MTATSAPAINRVPGNQRRGVAHREKSQMNRSSTAASRRFAATSPRSVRPRLPGRATPRASSECSRESAERHPESSPGGASNSGPDRPLEQRVHPPARRSRKTKASTAASSRSISHGVWPPLTAKMNAPREEIAARASGCHHPGGAMSHRFRTGENFNFHVPPKNRLRIMDEMRNRLFRYEFFFQLSMNCWPITAVSLPISGCSAASWRRLLAS